MPSLEAVLEQVRERVTPRQADIERLESAVEKTMERTEAAIEDLPVEAEALQVGSTARETWLASDRDIDIFVRFPRELSRAQLEEYGLDIGYTVLPDGREEYAEHPYVTGTVDGFDVDLVPCYAVANAADIESPVDRTPFHAEYVTEHLTPELATEVRVFKQFTKAIGVYGSNLRTRGFSGYLLELLVLEYGSTRAVLEAASDWHPQVVLDPNDHGEVTFDDPLVVIDPTDPQRNVAAVLSGENLARLQHHARDVLQHPTVDAFMIDTPDTIDADTLESKITARGTSPVALVFETPDLVDDDLHPQLQKSLDGIGALLERHDFDTIRTAYFTDNRTVLFYELEVPNRPAVERHRGPPVHVRSHAEEFFDTYVDADVFGPFIEHDRYVVERDREFRAATALLESETLFDARLAPAIEAALETGFELLAGQEITALTTEFDEDLARYFDPGP